MSMALRGLLRVPSLADIESHDIQGIRDRAVLIVNDCDVPEKSHLPSLPFFVSHRKLYGFPVAKSQYLSNTNDKQHSQERRNTNSVESAAWQRFINIFIAWPAQTPPELFPVLHPAGFLHQNPLYKVPRNLRNVAHGFDPSENDSIVFQIIIHIRGQEEIEQVRGKINCWSGERRIKDTPSVEAEFNDGHMVNCNWFPEFSEAAKL